MLMHLKPDLVDDDARMSVQVGPCSFILAYSTRCLIPPYNPPHNNKAEEDITTEESCLERLLFIRAAASFRCSLALSRATRTQRGVAQAQNIISVYLCRD